jgi:FkbM family methyltransferase
MICIEAIYLRVRKGGITELAGRGFHTLIRYCKAAISRRIDHLIEILSRKNRIIEFRDHHFIGALDAQSLVVDLGAHKGEFSAHVSRTYGCRCIAIEANPALYGGIIENALLKKYNYAISGQNGPIRFYVSENLEASSINKDISDVWGTREGIEVAGISFEDLLAKCQIATIDLLKVDIEGGEIEMFQSMGSKTIQKIKQITIEFHTFCNPMLEKNVFQIKARLRNLGFICLPFPLRASISRDCDTLFVNRRGMDFSWKERVRTLIPMHALKIALHLHILKVKLGQWRASSLPHSA